MQTSSTAASASPTSQLDALFFASIARATQSTSPATALLSWLDWSYHLARSPGKQFELGQLALTQTAQLSRYLQQGLQQAVDETSSPPTPPIADKRFSAPEWAQWPFNCLQQSFLLTQHWWEEATRNVSGVDKHHEMVVAFAARQWLDMLSPGNQLATNPSALQKTLSEGGANLARGFMNWLSDAGHLASGEPEAETGDFVVGRDVATTEGQVILRNEVMELIQYAPATASVHPEPVLLIPAWIMKYYILDLSPQNSLIRYLVDQGHTVFCISWKNPKAEDRNLGMDEYLASGFHAALDAINSIAPRRKVHAAGYCLGGTLLAIAAAAMARDGDQRLASATFFAAQTDFSEPGELALFIDESQVSMLEAQMADKGYLEARQMAGAFQLLRSNDLLWSRLINGYLLGEQAPMNDLMAWNADATRMPARMHSQYLRRLFLNNDLSNGRYPVNGRAVSLGDLKLPMFMVGTVTDHVAPWKSVHKLHYLCAAEITFALTSGGHNAGIVNPPGNSRRHYQLLRREAGAPYLAPEDWLAAAPQKQGSWWPAWQQWLVQRSGKPIKPPRTGSSTHKPTGAAPGTYVLER